jgi:hypothetical protein
MTNKVLSNIQYPILDELFVCQRNTSFDSRVKFNSNKPSCGSGDFMKNWMSNKTT